MSTTGLLFSLCILLTLICSSCASTNVVNGPSRKSNVKVTAKTSGPVFYYDKREKQTYVNKEAQFSIRSIDHSKYLSHIEVSVDNSRFEKYSGALRFKTEGPHILRFRSVDPVSNWSPMQTHKIYVDMTPPNIKPYWEGETDLVDGKLFVVSKAVLKFEAQDNLSGVNKIRIKSEGDKTFRNFVDAHKNIGHGPRAILYAAEDNVGNVTVWKKIEYFADAKPPACFYEYLGANSKTSNRNYVNNSTLIVLKAKDDDSGLKEIEYKINNNPIQVYKHPISLKQSINHLMFRAIDNVGNKSIWKEAQFHKDLKAPEVAIREAGKTVKDRGVIYVKPGFSLHFDIKDGDSGVKKILVSRDREGFKETKNRHFVFNQPGIQHFVLRAFDTVGNVSESEVYSIFVDRSVEASTTKAKKDLVKHNGAFLSALPNSIDILGNDSGAGIDFVEYSYDGKVFTKLTSPIDLSKWKTKRQTIYYRGVDRLGNKEKAQKLTVQLQTTSPLVDIFIDTSNVPNVPYSQIIKGVGKDKSKTKLSH